MQDLSLSQIPADSLQDVRRASEQLSASDLKEFAKNVVRLSELYPTPRAPIGSQGVWKRCKISGRAIAYKNLLGVSISFLLVFSPYLSEQSLQSSLNTADNLGLVSLVVLFGAFVLAGVATPSVLRVFGTKHSLGFGYVAFLLYTLANYYPHWYTLIPASLLLGISFGPIWASLNTHVTSIAYKFAPNLGEDPAYLVIIFNGVLVFFFKVAYLPGNVISSLVLFSGREEQSNSSQPTDSSIQSVCNNTEAASLDRLYLYILVSVFVVFDVLAILLLVMVVDNLKTERKFMSLQRQMEEYVKQPLIGVVKMFFTVNMNLLLPIPLLNGVMIAFALGAFPKLYVSDCIGVHWVGFTLIPFGVGSAVSSMVGGRLLKCIPQYVLVYLITGLNASLLLFLLLWERQPTYYMPFFFLFAFGICEGTWQLISASNTGILFPNRQEYAFSALRVWFATGFVCGFVIALFLDLEAQLWVILGIVILHFLTYSVLIVKTQTKKQLLPCCFCEVDLQ